MKQLFGIGLAFVLAVSGSVWGFKHFRRDPQWAKVQELREDLRSEEAKELPTEERREKWKTYVEEVRKLTPEQRDQLFQERERQRQQEIEQYFTLPREEQIKHLDAQIDREEEMRQRWEKAKAQREAARAEAAKNGTGESKAGQSQEGGQGAQQGPGPGQGGPGGWGSMTPEERDKRRRAFLDQTTPEQRARRAEYRRQLDERRKERGLPASGGLRGGRA